MLNRREFMLQTTMAAAACVAATPAAAESSYAAYQTPYKYPKLVLAPTGRKGDFDEQAIDDPIVFRAHDGFYMLYTAFDGIGYQTGLARSSDLLHWERAGLVGPRDPSSPYTRNNLSLNSILRNKNLHGNGEALKVDGHYLAAWNAYPGQGYENGAGVIGLARSTDLMHWKLTEPILFPAQGGAWEKGGLYRPDLCLFDGTYYLYYNAKNFPAEGTMWHEQTGVATSPDLRSWTRYAGNPVLRNGPPGSLDSRFASNPFVMRSGAQYAMFYFAFNDAKPEAHAVDTLALASTPEEFHKTGEVLIPPGAPGSIDSLHAHKPSIIYHDKTLYHFYCAVSDGKDSVRGIAVARSRPWA